MTATSNHDPPPQHTHLPAPDLDAAQARLHTFPLFHGLSESEMQAMASIMKVRHFKLHATLFHYGDLGSSMYFICAGKVKFFHQDDTGAEHELEEVGEGAFFGEVATLNGGIRTATARVTQDMIALEMKREDLLQLLPENPDLTLALLGGLAARLSHSADQLHLSVASNISKLAEEKSTPQDRFVHSLARRCGSFELMAANTLLVLGWMGISHLVNGKLFDGPTFNILTLLLSVEALFITAIVLNSQNLQASADALRDNEAHRATLAAEKEVRLIRRELAVLRAERQRLLHHSDQHHSDPH